MSIQFSVLGMIMLRQRLIVCNTGLGHSPRPLTFHQLRMVLVQPRDNAVLEFVCDLDCLI